VDAAAQPRLLLIETSSRAGLVALAEGHRLLGQRQLEEARRHARDLAPAVRDLLAGQNWRAHNLHAVVVSRGPGSYTGLRVGTMSAKALAFAAGCVLLAIDTFASLAAQAPDEVTSLDVVADAQQDKIYVQRFGRAAPAQPLQPLAPLSIQPFAGWLGERQADAWVSGPGLVGLRQRLPESVRVLPPELWLPRPESLLALALARLANGERDDLWTLEPLYLRPSSAEEKWQQRSS
jgi:tRNA threonylcarbamoyladenosine biosynthesis protein TsaB